MAAVFSFLTRPFNAERPKWAESLLQASYNRKCEDNEKNEWWIDIDSWYQFLVSNIDTQGLKLFDNF